MAGRLCIARQTSRPPCFPSLAEPRRMLIVENNNARHIGSSHDEPLSGRPMGDSADAQVAAAEIIADQKGHDPGGLSMRDLRDEGRR
jgi:hypothetical protein